MAATASLKVVGSQDWVDGSTYGEVVLNAVSNDKPKRLLGLDQKVRGQVQGLQCPLAQMQYHRRIAATLPTRATAAQRGKPVASPCSAHHRRGTANREVSLRGGG